MHLNITDNGLDALRGAILALTELARGGFHVGDVDIKMTNQDSGELNTVARLVLRDQGSGYPYYRLALDLDTDTTMGPRDLMVLTKEVIANN